jgi:hypothetical protein
VPRRRRKWGRLIRPEEQYLKKLGTMKLPPRAAPWERRIPVSVSGEAPALTPKSPPPVPPPPALRRETSRPEIRQASAQPPARGRVSRNSSLASLTAQGSPRPKDSRPKGGNGRPERPPVVRIVQPPTMPEAPPPEEQDIEISSPVCPVLLHPCLMGLCLWWDSIATRCVVATTGTTASRILGTLRSLVDAQAYYSKALLDALQDPAMPRTRPPAPEG